MNSTLFLRRLARLPPARPSLRASVSTPLHPSRPATTTSTPSAPTPASQWPPRADEIIAANEHPDPAKPIMRLSQAQRDWLAAAVRVNQTGELAARLIYLAQAPPVLRSHPHLRPTMDHMYAQEQGHFDLFSRMIVDHRIRPTAMYPVWELAATFLGWSTAVLGREAAMA
ncbi:hypothetical protein KEM52_005713, partial [Ascosphaera acerosa]